MLTTKCTKCSYHFHYIVCIHSVLFLTSSPVVVGVAVLLGVGVAVLLGVGVAVLLGMGVAVLLAVGVAVLLAVGVAVLVDVNIVSTNLTLIGIVVALPAELTATTLMV